MTIRTYRDVRAKIDSLRLSRARGRSMRVFTGISELKPRFSIQKCSQTLVLSRHRFSSSCQNSGNAAPVVVETRGPYSNLHDTS